MMHDPETQLARIVGAIGVPLVVYDAEFRFRFINASAAASMGRGPESAPGELVGRTVWEVFPHLVGTRTEREMRRAAAERVAISFEEYYPETSTRTEVSCSPMEGGDLLVLWKDVSERHRAEEALFYLAEVSRIVGTSLDYERTLASLADAVVPRLADWCTVDIVEEDGEIRQLALAHADPAQVEWARELNRRYPPRPDAPTGARNVIRTGLPELIPDITDEMLVAGTEDEEHLRIARGLGLRSAITVPLIARGATLGALTLVSGESRRRYTGSDLELALEIARRSALAIDNARLFRDTEQARVRLEEQTAELEAQAEEMGLQAAEMEEMQVELEVANTELRGANEALLEATAVAEDASRAKSDFLATMSHELRTPLNAMVGYTELLLLGVPAPIPEEAQVQVERIGRAARHLRSVIDEILTFSRIEAGQETVIRETVPLAELVEEVGAVIQPLAAEKGLALVLPEGGTSDAVTADSGKLRQILINLLGNAVKFTKEGEVRFEVTRAGDEVHFSVRDTGEGIAPEHQQSIFEPFRQVGASRTRLAEGSGLGLAISLRLARLLGGDITLESAPGAGSTFTLRLPAE
jgi:signal transduction histidine kinase